jgi:hypothetical protein
MFKVRGKGSLMDVLGIYFKYSKQFYVSLFLSTSNEPLKVTGQAEHMPSQHQHLP